MQEVEKTMSDSIELFEKRSFKLRKKHSALALKKN